MDLHSAPNQVFEKRHFLVDRKQIAYLRFILESYDSLCFLRTLESREALIEIAFHPSRRRDAEELLDALTKETTMVATQLPDGFVVPPI